MTFCKDKQFKKNKERASLSPFFKLLLFAYY